jgi:soluble lytic murein transglycosylase-like protein
VAVRAIALLLAAHSVAAAAGPSAAAGPDTSSRLASLLRVDLEPETVDSYPWGGCFRSAAETYRLPLILLLGVASGESAFDKDAVSRSRRTGEEIAHGVMQIKWPETAQDLGFEHKTELYEPCRNILAGARYLRFLLDTYDQSTYHALAAYNYGPGRIRMDTALPKGARWYVSYITDKMSSVRDRRFRHLDSAPFYIFSTYYRASRFKDYLAGAAADAGVSVEVQKLGFDTYAVMIRADDPAGLRRAMSVIGEHTGLQPMRDDGAG